MMSAQSPAAAGASSGSSLTGGAVPSRRAVTELRSLPPAVRRPYSEHREGSDRDDLRCPDKHLGKPAADLLAFIRNVVGTERGGGAQQPGRRRRRAIAGAIVRTCGNWSPADA